MRELEIMMIENRYLARVPRKNELYVKSREYCWRMTKIQMRVITMYNVVYLYEPYKYCTNNKRKFRQPCMYLYMNRVWLCFAESISTQLQVLEFKDQVGGHALGCTCKY